MTNKTVQCSNCGDWVESEVHSDVVSTVSGSVSLVETTRVDCSWCAKLKFIRKLLWDSKSTLIAFILVAQSFMTVCLEIPTRIAVSSANVAVNDSYSDSVRVEILK